MILDSGFWISRFGLWSFGCGFWILDFEVWTLEFWLWLLDFGFRGLDFGVVILDFCVFFWILGFGLELGAEKCQQFFLDLGCGILEFFLDPGFWT